MSALTTIRSWFEKYLGEPDAVYLVCIVIAVALIVLYLGVYLSPIITAGIFAFVLNDFVLVLTRMRCPRIVAISVVVLLFVSAAAALMIGILPLVSQQFQQLVNNIPALVEAVRNLVVMLSDQYPDIVSTEYMQTTIDSLQGKLTEIGGVVIQGAFTQIPNVIALLVFLVLVPICLFFALKDHHLILSWITSLLPRNRPVLENVGREMSYQITRYIRGKVIEIVLVGITTYVVFWLLGMNYAALLGLLVGLSVIVPFIGAVLVTIPVVLVATLQFGWSLDLLWILGAYIVIQVLDGNVLVPLLFSKAVNLHPLAIISAVLVCGGIWGIWGVFFAIPIAILIKTLIASWPRQPATETEVQT